MNIVGNVISGQVTGDTAKQLSERFGKIMQDRTSLSINSEDTSTSKSLQLEYAIPASKISGLSSGQFVGMVADDPANKIALKVFHNEIQNDHDAIKKEEDAYQPIPVIQEVTSDLIQNNYIKIKDDIKHLLLEELAIVSERNKALDVAGDFQENTSVQNETQQTGLEKNHEESNGQAQSF